MWQADSFDLPTIDRELALAKGLGFNSVRVFLHDLLWEQDSKGFLDRVDNPCLEKPFDLAGRPLAPHPAIAAWESPKGGAGASEFPETRTYVIDARDPIPAIAKVVDVHGKLVASGADPATDCKAAPFTGKSGKDEFTAVVAPLSSMM